MADEITRRSQIANRLLTDLQPLYALECLGQPLPWDQAVQIVADAFDQVISAHVAQQAEAVKLAAPTANGTCPWCKLPRLNGWVHTPSVCYDSQHYPDGPPKTRSAG